jgi:DNA-binding GntR family transcriptional regulator
MTNIDPHRSPALPPLRRSLAPLREQVLEELRAAIIAGRLAPGSRLIEREIIEMLGVSRTVVREALRQLESEGLIAGDAKKGMVVRALTPAEARDLYAIRGLLEGLAARRFVEHAGESQIAELAQALKATVAAYGAGDPAAILETKNRLYRCLFDGAASETLSSMVGLLHARISRWRALGLGHPRRSPKRSKESIRALQALLAAVRARDADRAELIMRDEAGRAAAEVMRLLAHA